MSNERAPLTDDERLDAVLSMYSGLCYKCGWLWKANKPPRRFWLEARPASAARKTERCPRCMQSSRPYRNPRRSYDADGRRKNAGPLLVARIKRALVASGGPEPSLEDAIRVVERLGHRLRYAAHVAAYRRRLATAQRVRKVPSQPAASAVPPGPLAVGQEIVRQRPIQE